MQTARLPRLTSRTARALFTLATLGALGALSACTKGDASGDAAGGASAGAASSAAAASGDQTLETLHDYKLSMDKIDKWNKGMRNVALAIRGDSALGEKFSSDGRASIDQEVARIEAEPKLKKAITDAGLSVREFELIQWTSFQAGMAQAAIDAGANRDSIIKNLKVHPDNLAFLKQNGAEIQRRQQQMAREMGEAPGGE